MTYAPSSSSRSLLEGMAPTRRDILVDLKMRQGGTVEDLAEHLHLSPGAVRHQLALLTAEGYVRFEGVPRDGRGRRPRDYQLTRKGDELFPNVSEEIALRLLTRLRRQNPDALESAVNAEMEEMEQTLGYAVQGGSFDERLDRVIQVLEDRFFFPTVDTDEDGSVLIYLNHAPAAQLMEAIPDSFDMETAIIRRAFPDADIETLEHRSRGDQRCVFKVSGGKSSGNSRRKK